MKRTIATVTTVALCVGMAGARSPEGKLTRFDGEEFSKVINYSSSDLEYIPGSPRVEIIGSKEARENIMLMSSDGNLMIHSESKRYEKEPPKIRVYGHKVEIIVLYGSGDAKIDRLSGSNVCLSLYGSGDITAGDVKSTVVVLGVFGSGDLEIDNVDASTVKANVGGSGEITMRKLNSNTTELNVMGSGDLNVPSVNTTSFRAVVTGSGDITASGKCTNASLMCQGSGNINARGLRATKVSKIIQGSGDIHN